MSGFEDVDSGSGFQGTEDSGINPAWNEVFTLIPEEHRESAKGVFSKWDSNFQKEIEKVQSKFEPYGFLAEKNIPGDDVRMALNIVDAIQQNPEAFYNNFGESFGLNKATTEPEQNQGLFDSANAESSVLPPEISKQIEELRKGQETMAQIILQKQQAEDEARKDRELQEELGNLRSQHGNFDEQFVLTQMMNGANGEDAVKAYQQLVEKIRTEDNRPKPPRLLSSGSGVPGENRVDVGKLGNSEVNKLVADYLRQTRAANS